ncbi:hypothetical protein [Hymenobacter algoricola]|uniref:Helix-turn-helix domain-containing protein n=1 Tax=Hymenobacter algoricola TaxID=486267 RepID=A0ABP7MHH4_9BACT
MNYICHTRAIHEQLSRQPAATPHHVSLYWALFFQWNASHFAPGIDLHHQTIMQVAHIGNERTYRAALRDLEAWGLLTYQPSISRHQPSRCFLTDASGAEVPEVNRSTRSENAPDKSPSTTGKNAPDTSRLSGAKVAPVKDSPRAEVPPVLLIENKTDCSSKHLHQNGSGGPKKKEGQIWPDEELSGDDDSSDLTNPTNGAGETQKKTPRLERGAPKKKRVGPSHARRPEVPFMESELASYDDFATAFEGTDYALADLRYYHARISAWRQKGHPPRRRDWHATAIQFFLNDAHDNRLKLAPGISAYQPGAASTDAGTLFARTGYRSKYDS